MNNGVFVEYVNVLVNLFYVLLVGFFSEVGVLIELLVVGMYVVKKVGSLFGQNVVVVGVGIIGLSIIMCVCVVGVVQVIVLEMFLVCKVKVLEVGVSQVFDFLWCDVLGEICVFIGGFGVDVSFECIGNKYIVKLVIDVICKVGKCVFVGIFEEFSEFNFFELVFIEKQLFGVFVYNGEFVDVIVFIVDGCFDIVLLVIGCIGLEEIVECGFEELVNNKEYNVKIIVLLGG